MTNMLNGVLVPQPTQDTPKADPQVQPVKQVGSDHTEDTIGKDTRDFLGGFDRGVIVHKITELCKGLNGQGGESVMVAELSAEPDTTDLGSPLSSKWETTRVIRKWELMQDSQVDLSLNALIEEEGPNVSAFKTINLTAEALDEALLIGIKVVTLPDGKPAIRIAPCRGHTLVLAIEGGTIWTEEELWDGKGAVYTLGTGARNILSVIRMASTEEHQPAYKTY